MFKGDTRSFDYMAHVGLGLCCIIPGDLEDFGHSSSRL